MSETSKSIYAALLAAQKEMTAAKKNAQNPHFKSDYPTLESVLDAVKEPLNNAGVVIMQPMELRGDAWAIVTRLIHAESAEVIESAMPVVAKDMTDPQKWGSAITYARRYTLQALVSLPATDDDGNAGAEPPRKQATKPATPPETKQADKVKDVAKQSLWNTAKKFGLADIPKLEAYAAANGINVPLSDMTPKDMNTLEGLLIVNETKTNEGSSHE